MFRVAIRSNARRFLLRRERVDVEVVSQLSHHAHAVVQVRQHCQQRVRRKHLLFARGARTLEVHARHDAGERGEQVVVRLAARVAHAVDDEAALKRAAHDNTISLSLR